MVKVLSRQAIQRMISRQGGETTVINHIGGEGGGGGSQPSVTLGPLLSSLNTEAMPSAEGYLHWSGTAWEWTTPTGGDPVDLTPYALKTWVQNNFATLNNISGLLTKAQADGYYAPISFVKPYLPLAAGSDYPLTGSLYITGNAGINWVGASGGYGMLCFRPTSGWSGVTSNQWGVGSHAYQGIIRSSDALERYDGTSNYTIWDSSNLDPLNYLRKDGGTVVGELNVKTLLNVQSSAGANKVTIYGSTANIEIASGGLITFNLDSYVAHNASDDTLRIYGNNGLLLQGDVYVGSVVNTNLVATQGYVGSSINTACDNLFASVVSDVTVSGDNLVVSKNGTNTPITVPYATNAGGLKTARLIWGQSFDGTGNVTGDLTMGGSDFLIFGNVCTFAPITLGDSPQSFDINSSVTTTFNIGSTSNHVLRLNNNNVRIYKDLYAIGNVGIGTTSPEYKLDVDDVVRSTVGFVVRPENSDYVGFNNEGISYRGASASSAVQLMDFGYNSSTNVATVKFPVRPQVGSGNNYTDVALVSDINTAIDNYAATVASTYATKTQLSGYLPLKAGSSYPLTGQLKVKNSNGIVIVDANEVHDFGAFWTTHTFDNVSREIFTAYAYETKYWDICIGTHPNAISYGGLYMYNSGNNNLRWGIGTASPEAKLHVDGSVKIAGVLTGVTNINGMMVLDSTNLRVGLGTATPTAKLDVNGTGYFADDTIIATKLAVGASSFDGTNAKLQVTGNITASGSITSKSNYGNVTMANGYVSATNLYITKIIFGQGSNDPSLTVTNGHLYFNDTLIV